jgi:excisionase family DNA binding protein
MYEHGFRIVVSYAHADTADQATEPSAETGYAVPQLTRLLTESLAATRGLAEIAERLQVGPSSLLTELANVAAQMPAGADRPSTALTTGEHDALARAGSLVEELPSVSELASLRTALRTAQLEKEMLSVKQAADLLHVSEGRVRQRLIEGTLLGSKSGASWRVPRFQFGDDGELPGWDRVAAALPRHPHPLSVARFLDTPDEDLDVDGAPGSPRRWLAQGGDAEAVVALAAALYDVP